jgi:hypothetical protein
LIKTRQQTFATHESAMNMARLAFLSFIYSTINMPR